MKPILKRLVGTNTGPPPPCQINQTKQNKKPHKSPVINWETLTIRKHHDWVEPSTLTGATMAIKEANKGSDHTLFPSYLYLFCHQATHSTTFM